ncbi:AarF/UbiB family protein, partial [uncultured Succinivibrio sp.]|uniref:AarF/UbiB family protein n=1 Tax=uncultured Succinivibrio sp. TaxID=540749 RepID=UPI0025F05A97
IQNEKNKKTNDTINFYSSLDRLCRELYSITPDNTAPGAALAEIINKEAGCLARIIANRTLLNEIREPAQSVIKKLVDYCEHNNLKTGLLISNYFKKPDKTFKINLFFVEKEAENPLYKGFLKKVETDLSAIEQTLDCSIQKKAQLFSQQLITELTAKEKPSSDDLKAILEKNSEALKQIYEDKICLSSLSVSVQELLEEIAKTNPEFKVPITLPQAQGQMVLDIAEYQRMCSDYVKIGGENKDANEAIKQQAKLFNDHAELLYKFREEDFLKRVLDEISSKNEILEGFANRLAKTVAYHCNSSGEKIQSLDEFKKIFTTIQNGFAPAKDTANLNPAELKEFKQCSAMFKELDTNAYALQMHEFTGKLSDALSKDIADGKSTIGINKLKEIFAQNLELFDRLLLNLPKDHVDYKHDLQDTFSEALVNSLKANVARIFDTEQKDGFEFLLEKTPEERFELYMGLLTDEEEGKAVPELKAGFDKAIERLADSLMHISPQSRDGLEPTYLSELGLQNQDKYIGNISTNIAEYSAKITNYFRAVKQEKPAIEKQLSFEKKLEDEKVHNFFADLILNFDGSKYDSVMGDPNAKPGTRIVNTILEHVGTFNRLLSDPEAINTLPENVRNALGGAISGFRGQLLLNQLEEVGEPPLGGEREPDSYEIIDQIMASPLKDQLNIQDPATEKNYVDIITHLFNNKMLPYSALSKLAMDMIQQERFGQENTNKILQMFTLTEDQIKDFSIKEPFKKLNTPNDQTLERIIKNKLLPLDQLKELIFAMDASGYLHVHKPDYYIKVAEKAYGNEKVPVKEPFMLAEPGSLKMGVQMMFLKTKLEELLKNPEDEMWEVIGNAETALNNEIDAQAQLIGNEIAEKFNEALKTDGEQKAPLDPTNKDVTLKQLQDEGNSSFNKTALGKFIGEVMKTYFKDMSAIDRRSMLAAMVRYSKSDSSPAQILGAMFKGAGPIMQKILQRLPPEALSDDLKTAFADMKCNLSPIPDRIIQAHLLEIVNSSHGEISKISVVKSLGAASVGQAVLCKFYTKEHPEGIDKVVKFLRPDVQNRAEREKQLFIEAAKKVPGMDVTFAGDLKTILEELDLTIEANNVESGQIYSNNSTKVKSMTLSPLVRPTTDVMVLDLAPGITLDKCIRDANENTKLMLRPFTHIDMRNGTYMERHKFTGKVTDKLEHQNYKVSLENYNKLSEQYQTLLKQQQNLMTFTKNWVTEGIFGKGFYHGDLHAGNIMTSPDQLTVIDFGNCTQLTADQQQHIIRMMAAAMYSDSSAFIDSLTALLSETSKARLNEHVDKNDPNTPLVKDRLKAVISAVLSKGSRKDAGARILVALQEVLKLGVEMPAPIYNFSKCQIALNNAIEETNKALQDTFTAMRIAAANVDVRQDDPVSIFMYNIGAENTRDEKERIKIINRFCTNAKKDLNRPEYKEYIRRNLDYVTSEAERVGSVLAHIEGHEELKVMYEEYRQTALRKAELEEILKKIPAPGTENNAQKEAENQIYRELITKELESVKLTANEIFEGFFEQFKGIVAQDIDEIAEKARGAAKGAKGYEDFLDCMAEVLTDKRSQAVGALGTGKIIKYAIPMLIDSLA